MVVWGLGSTVHPIDTLRPRQNGRHFADDIFKRNFLNENIRILIKISLKFVPKRSIYNIPALVQIMTWRRPGDKPLSEPMMVNLPTHICVTRPQWVKYTHDSVSAGVLGYFIRFGQVHVIYVIVPFTVTISALGKSSLYVCCCSFEVTRTHMNSIDHYQTTGK